MTGLDEALAVLRDDGLVAFPTETVWGLAARATRLPAIEALRAWKGRGPGHPFSVLVSGEDALYRLVPAPGPVVHALIEAFWPGPLTLVLTCRKDLAEGVAAHDGSVGFRCSPHPTAASLVCAVEQAGLGPITASSLNRSGEGAARTLAEGRALCVGAAAPYLFGSEGPEAGGLAPSTVVDCTGPEPEVLREGAITPSALRDVLAPRCAAGDHR